ncbi:hypothetical protein [Deinococcus sp.]|uniref:hypothetical protein n=1 Tax=Deinococcus sp. TaxID=47478 RepID=UPI0025B7B159|nr:hypothetical protein [Deinococcus sp.]
MTEPPALSAEEAHTLDTALALGDGQARMALAILPVSSGSQAAARALALGRPHLTLEWTDEPLLLAAAHLRLGRPDAALSTLSGLPDTARPALLRARAAQQGGAPDALAQATHARTLARADGDGGALVAAATLLAEYHLRAGAHHEALRTLAEGLKVAEMTGQPADPYLLAVLAHAQKPLNSRKAAATAAKALDRGDPGSPARVLALLALDRPDEAHAQAQRGSLAAAWWEPFAGLVSAARPPATTPETDGTAADG